jgi:UDP-N-acetylglucosamine 2-epimerase
MLEGLEPALAEARPDVVVVFGDTNSTLAGALAAAKLGLPLAHVEAGLRSFDRSMPEEVNRVVADHLATWLFCPTSQAVDQLAREGIVAGVHAVGDLMYDALLAFLPRVEAEAAAVYTRNGVAPGGYFLATVHRAANTDDPARLDAIVGALAGLPAPVLLPLHPRTRAALDAAGIALSGALRPLDPVGYLEMVALEKGARAVLTDSGGVQREAYFLAVPCVTLREESEWPETLQDGWNVLAGADPAAILAAALRLRPTTEPATAFGDGHAATKILGILERDPRDGGRSP